MTKPRGCDSFVIGSGPRRHAPSGTLAIREPIQEIEHRLDKVEKRCACLTRDPIFMLAVPHASRARGPARQQSGPKTAIVQHSRVRKPPISVVGAADSVP